MIILVDIAWLDPTGAEQLLRVSSTPFCSGRQDTPPDTAWLPLLAAPPQVSVSSFALERGGGAARHDIGKISLVNADGRFDWLLTAPVDGRAVTIRIGQIPDTGRQTIRYPDDFTIWMRATAAGVEAPNRHQIDILVRDGMAVLDRALATTVYAGDNELPFGVEGTAEDLRGRVKPRLFGVCTNISPICVNTSKLIYQFNDRAGDATVVRDRGAALMREADYVDLEDMMDTAPGAGAYRVWPVGGLLRVGSAVTLLTADVETLAATPARIMARIAAEMGVAADDDDVAALDLLQPEAVGVWIDDNTTALAAIDRLASGLGCWVTVGEEGTLRLGRFDVPGETPSLPAGVIELDDAIITELRVTETPLPVHKITLDYDPNWTRIAASQIAGSVDATDAAWFAQDSRALVWEEAAVIIAHPLAPTLERATALRSISAAQAELARLAALFGVARLRLRLTVPWAALARRGVPALGETVTVRHARYGLKAGRAFVVVSVETRAASGNVILGLWG
jgi:hypothetical protein